MAALPGSVLSMRHLGEINRLEADLRETALLLSRAATDTGARTGLDEVTRTPPLTFGFPNLTLSNLRGVVGPRSRRGDLMRLRASSFVTIPFIVAVWALPVTAMATPGGEAFAATTSIEDPVAIPGIRAEYARTQAQALRVQDVQSSLNEVDVAAAKTAGERFSSTWTHHGADGATLEVRLASGPGDVELEGRLQALHTAVFVTYGVDEEQAELAAHVTRQLPALQTQVDGLAGIGIDGASGHVIVDTVLDDEAVTSSTSDSSDRAVLPEALREQRDKAAAAVLGLDDSNIGTTVGIEPAGDHKRGGVYLSSCTAAFTVRNASGTRGFLTAGHCGPTQNWGAPGRSISNSSTYRNEARSNSADLQWHSLSATVYGQFYGTSSTNPTTLASRTVRSQQGGDSVCSRGKTSGWRCGTVTSISYRPLWSGACPGTICANVFVAVNRGGADGDSGGPWYSGTSAYGVHKGGPSSSVSVFTPLEASYLSALGLSLLYG